MRLCVPCRPWTHQMCECNTVTDSMTVWRDMCHLSFLRSNKPVLTLNNDYVERGEISMHN